MIHFRIVQGQPYNLIGSHSRVKEIGTDYSHQEVTENFTNDTN